MTVEFSGPSTPLSSTSTLSPSPPPHLKDTLPLGVFKSPQFSASNIIEFIASRSVTSSTVHIYDLAEQAGFGTLTKSWSKSDHDTASVVNLQTRAGAGLSLVGRLSEGTSVETVMGAVLTAYTTPAGLAAMAQSLSYLPTATPSSRLIIQVPTVTPVGKTFALSPTVAPLAAAFAILPSNITVLISATPQESVDIAALSYRLTNSHVIHLFDHYSSSRETGHFITPPSQSKTHKGIEESGYSYFDYMGDKEAKTVIVMLNGPLALVAKALAVSMTGLGVVVVRVLRPWNEAALRDTLPSTVKEVHVFDDVPNEATQGTLYVDVFGALLDLMNPPTVHAQRVMPPRTQEYILRPSTFKDLLLDLAPKALASSSSLDSPGLKKLLFFSAPNSPLSALPHFIEDTFLPISSISTRLLTDHDVFSKAGGITVDRILLSQKGSVDHSASISVILPVTPDSQGESDFLCVLDHTLLKSHSILVNAKRGSAVLVVTSWSSTELLTNLPPGVSSLILDRALHVYTIDAKTSASTLFGATGPAHDAVQTLLTHLAFLRLYLGANASEALVHQIARKAFGEVIQGIGLTKINAHAWAGLQEVEVPADSHTAPNKPPTSTPTPLKHFEFNAIAVETDEGDTVVNGARLSSWHDAARHLLFPAVFSPPAETSSNMEEYPQNPALRPEVPERTFLITTSVNRRLTPQEYDRNVFHLEFDTSGTGLKYAIGEALGIHGWNDEQDVLDFCSFYGADPNQLVTIPVVAGEGKMHTRTILQALQQQVDLFGRPPKAFYSDLAVYATNSKEKHALQFIGSPEGSSTFKKLAEKDTVTFAEILERYPSARPSIEKLCEMIGDIKPRHYSIASAQSVVGDRVDLLVVTVEWVTPSGTYVDAIFFLFTC
jgi:sulfite reductase (NADPH) flavoprotein alpha-component